MNDTRITQAKEHIADAQTLLDAIGDELPRLSDEYLELGAIHDILTPARNRLAQLRQCPSLLEPGCQCGLDDGHYNQHERSFRSGQRATWNDNEAAS